MTSATNSVFGTWLNPNNTINLISNVAVVCINYEGITNFFTLTDFGNKIIELVPSTCKEKIPATTYDPAACITTEPAVPAYNTFLIAIRQLIVAVQASKYYT